MGIKSEEKIVCYVGTYITEWVEPSCDSSELNMQKCNQFWSELH
jgi:hypothetical protein